MRKRIQRFRELAACPVRKGMWQRLTEAQRHQCEDFIRARGEADYADFLNALNRHWLDQADRPKAWAVMWALLSEANGVTLIPRRRKGTQP